MTNISDLNGGLPEFKSKLALLKAEHSLGSRKWYPYQTLANLQHLTKLTEGVEFDLSRVKTIADIGAGDGDLGFYLASRGFEVDIYDYAPTNFNGLRGAHQLRILLDCPVRIFDMDLDRDPSPMKTYDLVLFLGILYHIKNPFLVMETLARRAQFVLFSTKTAKTFAENLNVDHTPSAYLLDASETNNDDTNYWVFTQAGLRRLFKRTGFEVLAYRVGSNPDSHPSRDGADERTFALLRSTRRSGP